MIQYISTRDEMVKDERITVARCFDSYWTADACRVEGEKLFRLVDVRYATRAPKPGDRLRVVSHEGGKTMGKTYEEIAERVVDNVIAHEKAKGASLAASRAATAERTRADRLRAAGEALEKCGLTDARAVIMRRLVGAVGEAGDDEPRYAAAMTARAALGRLWEVL